MHGSGFRARRSFFFATFSSFFLPLTEVRLLLLPLPRKKSFLTRRVASPHQLSDQMLFASVVLYWQNRRERRRRKSFCVLFFATTTEWRRGRRKEERKEQVGERSLTAYVRIYVRVWPYPTSHFCRVFKNVFSFVNAIFAKSVMLKFKCTSRWIIWAYVCFVCKRSDFFKCCSAALVDYKKPSSPSLFPRKTGLHQKKEKNVEYFINYIYSKQMFSSGSANLS